MNIFSKKIKDIFKSILLFFSVFLFFSPFFVLSAEDNGGGDSNGGGVLLENYGDFNQEIESAIKSDDSSKALAIYIDMIVKVSFGIGSIAAVALIIWGGIEYIGSESFAGKDGGKSKLLRAFGALTILFASFIFFEQINPEIMKARFEPLVRKQKVSTGIYNGTLDGSAACGARRQEVKRELEALISEKINSFKDKCPIINRTSITDSESECKKEFSKLTEWKMLTGCLSASNNGECGNYSLYSAVVVYNGSLNIDKGCFDN